jgi:hypothetical protein
LCIYIQGFHTTTQIREIESYARERREGHKATNRIKEKKIEGEGTILI